MAEALCDRIAIISKGEIIALGTMDELRAQAATRGGAHLEEIFLKVTGGEEMADVDRSACGRPSKRERESPGTAFERPRGPLAAAAQAAHQDQPRPHRRRAGSSRRRLLGFVGLFFWALIFAVIFRMLLYFRGTQGIGDLLSAKLLGLAFVTFLMILVLSNVITALSTFFLADDLELLVAAPVDPVKVYGARLAETIVDSSWMVALLAVPLLAAYGVVYAAGLALLRAGRGHRRALPGAARRGGLRRSRWCW